MTLFRKVIECPAAGMVTGQCYRHFFTGVTNTSLVPDDGFSLHNLSTWQKLPEPIAGWVTRKCIWYKITDAVGTESLDPVEVHYAIDGIYHPGIGEDEIDDAIMNNSILARIKASRILKDLDPTFIKNSEKLVAALDEICS